MTYETLNMQHITPNSKGWDYLDIPGGGQKKIIGPAHIAEGGHYLRKSPNPHPQMIESYSYSNQNQYQFTRVMIVVSNYLSVEISQTAHVPYSFGYRELFVKYREISNTRRTYSPKFKCFSSRLIVVFTQSIADVEDEDVAGAIILLIKVRLMLEIWRHVTDA